MNTDKTGNMLNTLPRQIMQSIESEPIYYNVMVMGEGYAGKTSLVRALFGIGECKPEKNDGIFHEVCDMACTNNPLAELMDASEHSLEKNSTSISATSYTLWENSISMHLTVYEVGGIGDSLHSSCDWALAKNLVLNRYEEYHLEEESGLLRNDKRVHVCLYLISPTDILRDIDVKCMREMGKIVNVIPILSKADMLTDEAYKACKESVFSALMANNVQLFDSIFIDECKKVVELNFMPLKYSTPGRVYPYTHEAGSSSDINTLRDLVISQHMVDLIEVTDAYYETYRRNKIIVDILIVKDSGISEDFQRRMCLEEAKVKKLAKAVGEKKTRYQMLIAQQKSTIPPELL
ncbi:septin 7 [Nematocida major]|uniref:septin 7 n=1 Tax=Nematocida major TaxID=1912982 RepID=UPI002007F967|nr:septin 7 [Nematocida major]XP_047772037.1 septin 7 [Nematocida major]KAH9387328.1 septin 7 [Nematocida major]KAH9387346.1 septin 7 [Nematocida major]